MKTLLLSMVLLMAACVASAGEVVEILRDPYFQNGFEVVHPDTKQVCRTDKSTEDGPEPAWQIAQWSTRFNLQDTLRRRDLDNGAIAFTDETKYVEFRHEDGMLVLGLDSVEEYQVKFREKTEGWPHLLVQQNFQSPFLGRFKSLKLSFDAKILEAENIEDRDKGYDPGLHAAQFQVFFIVKDDLPDSPGRHDFYWHGVPLYDSRKPFHEESLHVDHNPDMPEAQRRSIFVPSSREYIGDQPSLQSGRWISVEADLLPLIQDGLAKAKARGAFAKSPDTLDAYRLVHINIGWEMPGLARAKGAIRKLSLVGEMKN